MEWEEKKGPARLWAERAAKAVRWCIDRYDVEKELQEHIEDKADSLQRVHPEMEREEAERRAADSMGDPDEVGRELAKVHGPWPGRLLYTSRALVIILALVLLWCALWEDDFYSKEAEPFFLIDLATGMWELWDWDDMPASNRSEYIFLPGSEPARLMTRSYDQSVQVQGRTISLRRAALWQKGTTRNLYVYLRLEDWHFWAKGRLNREWFTATDSLGNTYKPAHSDPENWYAGEYRNGYGPFHTGYTLAFRFIDPEAEWVRLDYGPAEEILFSLTVELEGAA